MTSTVLIVGGGVAGSATAIALRRAGVTCTLLERSAGPRPRVGETLPPAARASLQRLGLWEDFVAQRHRVCHANVSLWGGHGVAVDNFLFAPEGPGWHIDRGAFDAWLLDHVARSGAEVHREAAVTRCVRDHDGVRVTFTRRSRSITTGAEVVIDAAGPTAPVARQLGGRRLDYDRMIGWALPLVPCEPRAQGQDDGFLLVEPVADGWWYAAPIPSGEIIAVFIAATTVRATDASGWRARLDATTAIRERCAGHRIGAIARPWPVVVGRLDRAAGPGWLAVGDAAASLDPLAATGMTRALASGIAAALALEGGDDGVRAYCRDIDRAFEEHLELRPRFYRAEPRWSDAPFWVRRSVVLGDGPITLDPGLVLGFPGGPGREVPRELGASLSRHEWRQLRQGAGPRPAWNVALELTSHPDNRAGDRRLVSAVQSMLACGTLRAA